jgi:hypothetical protein
MRRRIHPFVWVAVSLAVLMFLGCGGIEWLAQLVADEPDIPVRFVEAK